MPTLDDSVNLTIEDDDSWTLTLSDQGVSIAAAHADTHAAAGSDPLTLATTQITGLGTMATQDSDAVAITGGTLDGVTISSGTITGITDLAIADGGTGASSESAARTNLGLGTIATQAASSVTITGGSITGITDIVVADGGTGASTLTGIIQGNGTSAFTANASSTVGQVLRCTGINTYAFGSIDLDDTDAVTGTLPVANGGTNATTAAEARTNLGFGSGHVTLVGGEKTIYDELVTKSSHIVVTHHTAIGPTGRLYVDNNTLGEFTIHSTSAADDNDVDYIIIY